MITQRFRYFLIACKDFRTKPDQEKHCKNESRLHQDSHDFNPLLGSVEGNNRFVFGFITLVGSIWHRTFRAATASSTAIGLWMCAPPSPVSVSRVEKFSFVLLGVSLPAERERITVARSVNIALEISLWTGSRSPSPMYTLVQSQGFYSELFHRREKILYRHLKRDNIDYITISPG